MVQDAIKFAKASQACQIHGDFIHQPPQLLHLIILFLPFQTWGLDVIGYFKPSSSRDHVFILAATNYFSEWAEVIPLREVGAKQVTNCISTYLILDNSRYFKNQVMIILAEKYQFKHRFSSSYNPSVQT